MPWWRGLRGFIPLTIVITNSLKTKSRIIQNPIIKQERIDHREPPYGIDHNSSSLQARIFLRQDLKSSVFSGHFELLQEFFKSKKVIFKTKIQNLFVCLQVPKHNIWGRYNLKIGAREPPNEVHFHVGNYLNYNGIFFVWYIGRCNPALSNILISICDLSK